MESGWILLRKTLINTEESYQTGVETERRNKSFSRKGRFCVKKSLIKKGCVLFLLKGNSSILRGRAIFQKAILNDHETFCNK